jgi:hypothetical protein
MQQNDYPLQMHMVSPEGMRDILNTCQIIFEHFPSREVTVVVPIDTYFKLMQMFPFGHVIRMNNPLEGFNIYSTKFKVDAQATKTTVWGADIQLLLDGEPL